MTAPKFVVVGSSPHRREPDRPPPACPPADREAWEALPTLDAQALRELGCRPWGCGEDACDESATCTHGPVLWVYPGEWYPAIPDGFEIVTISFQRKRFVRGVTDDDTRLGCLPYGFLAEHAR